MENSVAHLTKRYFSSGVEKLLRFRETVRDFGARIKEKVDALDRAPYIDLYANHEPLYQGAFGRTHGKTHLTDTDRVKNTYNALSGAQSTEEVDRHLDRILFLRYKQDDALNNDIDRVLREISLKLD